MHIMQCTIETTILYFASLHLYMLYGGAWCFIASLLLRAVYCAFAPSFWFAIFLFAIVCATGTVYTVYLNLAKLHPVIMRILIVRSWRCYPEARASAHTFHCMVILLPRPYTLLLVRVAATGAADLLYAMHSMAICILALTWTQIRSVHCGAYSGSEFIIHNLWYGRLLLVGRQIGMTIDWIVCNDPSLQ